MNKSYVVIGMVLTGIVLVSFQNCSDGMGLNTAKMASQASTGTSIAHSVSPYSGCSLTASPAIVNAGATLTFSVLIQSLPLPVGAQIFWNGTKNGVADIANQLNNLTTNFQLQVVNDGTSFAGNYTRSVKIVNAAGSVLCETGAVSVNLLSAAVAAPAPVAAPAACDCQFSIAPYLAQGYTTTFYYDNVNSKMYSPAGGVMTLPGNMGGGTNFYLSAPISMPQDGSKSINFNCSKGILRTQEGFNYVGATIVNSVSPTCPNISCQFSIASYLAQGYTTTFYYDNVNSKMYSPAGGVMTLPGNMGGGTNFYLSAPGQQGSSDINYNCSKGILRTQVGTSGVSSLSPAY